MYQALDASLHEIRILRLLPGSFSDRIEVQLITTALDTQPIPYEALSYVWGHKSDPPDQIAIDGTSRDVTKNLHAALRGLRRDDQPRVLWVDAVCINQDDIPERNQQVRLMRRLYADATRVIAWLGDSNENPCTPGGTGGSGSGEDIAAIELLTSSDDIHWNDKRLRSRGLLLVATSWLESNWWYRAWTVQEAAVAQSLVYMRGKAEIQGEKLMKLCQSFARHGSGQRGCCNVNELLPDEARVEFYQTLTNSFEKLRTLESLGKKLHKQERGGPALSLSHAAALCRSRDATDPRDKVYAFVGLLRGFPTSWIDYSLSVGSTFEVAARQCIFFTKRLGVLSFCQYYPEPVHSERVYTQGVSPPLPSWVPDWTLRYDRYGKRAVAQRQDTMDYWMTTDAPRGWLASGMAACKAVISQHDPPGHLGVSGRAFGNVAVIGMPHLSPKPYYHEVFHHWRFLSGVDKDPMSPYTGGGSRLAAYRRTLSMNTSYRDKEEAYGTVDDMAHDLWWFHEMCGFKKAASEDMKGQPRGLSQLHLRCGELIMLCSIGRAFFISEKGYFGLAPSAAQAGDQVCILAGGQTPYILRRAGEVVLPDSGIAPAFKVVGDAYVHGIMHGEAMADVEEGRASLERWALI